MSLYEQVTILRDSIGTGLITLDAATETLVADLGAGLTQEGARDVLTHPLPPNQRTGGAQ